MTEKIDNSFLSAEISIKGAELFSLKKQETEYIWQRDPKYWNRSSPLLFPSVGRQKNDSYAFENIIYPVGMHGIADYLETKAILTSNTNLTLESIPTKHSSVSFPFDFKIISNFTLDGNMLYVSRTVYNCDNVIFPFCIGEHTGFSCSNPDTSFLVFEREENTKRALLNKEHYIGNENPIRINELSLSDSIFYDGAYILREWKSEYISLIEDGKEILRVYRGNYPAVALWRKPKASFVCVEPIQGFDSDICDNEDFLTKKNIVIIAPKESIKFSYSIMIV